MTIKKGTNKADIKRLLEKLAETEKPAGINAYKYCGVIKLKESPNQIQKHLRSEWN